ncbi:hypothetical protein [Lutibacter citreus]|uniref:hypothetical protein n=1 Tax=Lutibacter citreus TaxID=2138210 RepID=UPI000DBE52EE|nr:hypothetical protein [Lutibacter citreus]
MKTFKIFLLLVFTLIISCKEEKPKTNSRKIVKKEKHYICANKCENSGGDVQAICPTCKTPYVHNQAFHNNDLLKNGPLKVKSNIPIENENLNATAPSPIQNAQGVFHYTCSNGCPGGAGSAEKCKACGNELAHNSAYHNN